MAFKMVMAICSGGWFMKFRKMILLVFIVSNFVYCITNKLAIKGKSDDRIFSNRNYSLLSQITNLDSLIIELIDVKNEVMIVSECKDKKILIFRTSFDSLSNKAQDSVVKTLREKNIQLELVNSKEIVSFLENNLTLCNYLFDFEIIQKSVNGQIVNVLNFNVSQSVLEGFREEYLIRRKGEMYTICDLIERFLY